MIYIIKKIISFAEDIDILIQTVKQVFIRSDITESSEEIDVTDDYGDYLLKTGKVSREEYDAMQTKAKQILEAES